MDSRTAFAKKPLSHLYRPIAGLPRITQLSLLLLVVGVLFLSTGAGLRAFASVRDRLLESRLLAARPASPNALSANGSALFPASAIPIRIRLPAYDLWNDLEPVTPHPFTQDDQLDYAWNVADAGWHMPSLPGFGLNVVVAGHSPSRSPSTWAHSVFRQLAYLNRGDTVELTAGHFVYRYRITHIFAIPAAESAQPTATDWITPGGAERLTLITCWPPQDPKYRIIAVADPVSYQERTDHES